MDYGTIKINNGVEYSIDSKIYKPIPLVFDPNINKLIGTGVDLPFTYSQNGVSMNESLNLINDAISVILSTCKGDKLFEPEFGSNLCKLVFENIDDVLFDKLKIEIADALDKWLRVIKIINVSIDESQIQIDNNTIFVTINYVIRNTLVEGNYVYPYVHGSYNRT